MNSNEVHLVKRNIEQWVDDLENGENNHVDLALPSYPTYCKQLEHISDLSQLTYTALFRHIQPLDTCHRHRKHSAYIMLSTYSELDDDYKDFHFDLVFSVDNDQACWEEVRVHSVRSEYVDSIIISDSEHRPLITGHLLVVVFFWHAPNRYSAQSGVRWAERGPVSKRSKGWLLPRPKLVREICHSLGKTDISRSRRRNWLRNSNQDLWDHQPTARQFLPYEPYSLISYTEFLSNDVEPMYSFSKLALAVILGYSLFYLYEGPWIPCLWPRSGIKFFQAGDTTFLRPLLCVPFHSKESNPTQPDEIYHQYPILVGFATTLLEIHQGRTIKSILDLEEDTVNIDDEWARTCDAFERCKKNISEVQYKEVIEACLNPRFQLQNLCEGKELQQQIFDKIVVPLVTMLEGAFGSFNPMYDLDAQASRLEIRTGIPVTEVQKSRLAPRNSPQRIKRMHSPTGGVVAMPDGELPASAAKFMGFVSSDSLHGEEEQVSESSVE